MISIDFQAHGLLSNPSVNEGGVFRMIPNRPLLLNLPGVGPTDRNIEVCAARAPRRRIRGSSSRLQPDRSTSRRHRSPDASTSSALVFPASLPLEDQKLGAWYELRQPRRSGRSDDAHDDEARDRPKSRQLLGG